MKIKINGKYHEITIMEFLRIKLKSKYLVLKILEGSTIDNICSYLAREPQRFDETPPYMRLHIWGAQVYKKKTCDIMYDYSISMYAQVLSYTSAFDRYDTAALFSKHMSIYNNFFDLIKIRFLEVNKISKFVHIKNRQIIKKRIDDLKKITPEEYENFINPPRRKQPDYQEYAFGD